MKSIETPLAEEGRRVDDSAPQESFDEETPVSSQDTDSEDTDPEQTFNRKWGYLTPLDEEALAVIDAIIADPSLAEEYSKMKPESEAFREGLLFRNVLLKESSNPDPYLAQFLSLSPEVSIPETDEERKSHEQLWTSDQAKCSERTNEALFQRTLMMSLVARHVFIYDRDTTNESCLDFSVEESWTCPAMPTRAFEMEETFVTQPKPDLAVCFRRKALIPDTLWNKLPKATRHLACYESAGNLTERLFHFFTIEAKKAMITSDDSIGKCQSLNNASQALHNMFEFFRDAGPEHEAKFFSKVRFFSVVASAGGLTIRMHRATHEDGSVMGFITEHGEDYPLRFEYQDILTIERSNFGRQTVFETIKNILIGYGANELRLLLKGAAGAIMEKLKDKSVRAERQKKYFYCHGQEPIRPRSKKATPAANSPNRTPVVSRGQSVQTSRAMSETNMLHGLARSEPVSPTLSRPSTTIQAALDDSRKRGREQSVDSASARNTRQRSH